MSLPICFILPYLEVNAVRRLLTYSNSDAIFPANLVLVCIYSFLLLALTPRQSKTAILNPKGLNQVAYFKLVFDVYLLVFSVLSCLDKGNIQATIFQLAYFIIPFWYSIIFIRYIIMNGLNVPKVIRNGTLLFTAYLIANIAINLVNYGFTIGVSRLISTGGGSVLLGYTIALVAAFVLRFRPFSRAVEIMIILVFFIAVLMSGTRGGIWPLLLLIFVFAVTKRTGRLNVLALVCLFLVIILLNPLSFVLEKFPRVANFAESGRLTSIVNCLRAFGEQPLYEQIFGAGFGNVFPYQKWLINTDLRGSYFERYNLFQFNGQYLLAQPHNTYMYFLLETGIVGLLLYMILLNKVKNLLVKSNSNVFRAKSARIPFYTFVLLGMVESTVLIQPGTAGLWWITLLFSCLSRDGSSKQNIAFVECIGILAKEGAHDV